MSAAGLGDVFDRVARVPIPGPAGIPATDVVGDILIDHVRTYRRLLLANLIDALRDQDWDGDDVALLAWAHDPDVVRAFADNGLQLVTWTPLNGGAS